MANELTLTEALNDIADATGGLTATAAANLIAAAVSAGGAGGDIDGLSDAGLNATDDNLYLGNTIPGSETTATNNLAISGSGTALDAITTGDSNIAIGDDSLTVLTTGVRNVSIGHSSGLVLYSGDDNTFVGYTAGSKQSNDKSTMIGAYAGFGITNAVEVTAVGYQSYAENKSVSVGNKSEAGINGVSIGYDTGTKAADYNTIVGYSAGLSIAAGAQYNTLLGLSAGTSLYAGTNNVCLGANTTLDSSSRNDAIVIGRSLTSGAEDGSIAIGSNNVTGNIIRVESSVLTVGGVTLWKKWTGTQAAYDLLTPDDDTLYVVVG